MSFRVSVADDVPLTVMDGSMGRQLCVEGLVQDEIYSKIWSARALLDADGHTLIRKVHRDYINVGAKTLTTNNYGVQPNYYSNAFPNEDWQAMMVRDVEVAAKLAVEARDEAAEAGRDVLVLGCLPPLCESHRPDKFDAFLESQGEERLVGYYRAMADALVRGGVDAFIPETLNSWKEAELALQGCAHHDLPVFLCLEGGLRDHETFTPRPHIAPDIARKALQAKADGHNIAVLGFNCCDPEFIIEALRNVTSDETLSRQLVDAGIALGAYANCSGREHVFSQGYDVGKDKVRGQVREDLVGDGYVQFVEEMVHHGARYVGGCCGCGPDSILTLQKLTLEMTKEDAESRH
jgi:S-methylmethionine-dependent homocysteine/selenocysteine methylase